MCGLPIFAGGATLLSGVAGIAGGVQQNSYQRSVARRNQEIARQSANNRYGAIQQSLEEARLQASQAIRDTTSDALRATGRVQAAAGEANITGGAVDALMQDFALQEGRAIAAARLNRDLAERQTRSELEATQLGLQSQLIASTEPAKPDLFGQSLGVLGQTFGATMRADSIVRQNGGRTLFLPE